MGRSTKYLNQSALIGAKSKTSRRVGMAMILVVVLVSGFRLSRWVLSPAFPGATRPCDGAFAASLVNDLVFADRPTGASMEHSDGASGGCGNSDVGQTAHAELDYVSTSRPEMVLAHYSQSVPSHGWKSVRIMPEGAMGSAYSGNGFCAVKDKDGHHEILRVNFDSYSDSDTRWYYTVSIEADAIIPTCSLFGFREWF
jgi:hypothetical protein